ncbi:MAG: metallophosphatase family protein [Anaerolineales bacterium]|nr:metallophosphatase family protein [Anaerolineales bacterium]
MTRILVISDIHANLTALEAVLADAGEVDETWCLGDLVGYGPDPNECIHRIRSLPKLTCLIGNHDTAAIGNLALVSFNHDARRSLVWHKETVTKKNLTFLTGLPSDVVVCGEVSLAHGSPRDPIWEYVMNALTARINLGFFSTPWCFIGHSHMQVVFQQCARRDSVDIVVLPPGEGYELTERAILNPGSVGQPRDRNPRAAYALFYPEKNIWEPRRVEYDIQAVKTRILEAGLPPRHAERLAGGW